MTSPVLARGVGLLPLGAGGQYYIKVTGAANAAQLYTLTLTIAKSVQTLDVLQGTQESRGNLLIVVRDRGRH